MNKIFFCKIILICLLAIFSSGKGLSSCELITNVEQQVLTDVNDSVPVVKESKLTETEKGVKRSYQTSSESIPSDPTPVEIKTSSTVRTYTKVMDVETVDAFGTLFKDVNQSRDLSLELIAQSIADLNINVAYANYMMTAYIYSEGVKHQREMKQRKREVKTHLVFSASLLILSIFACVYFVRADAPWGRNICLFLAAVSLLATLHYSSDYISLFSKAGEVNSVEKSELGTTFASLQE